MFSSLKEQDTARITLVFLPKELEARKFYPPPSRPQKLRSGFNLTFVKMSNALSIRGWWRWWQQSCLREPWYSPYKIVCMTWHQRHTVWTICVGKAFLSSSEYTFYTSTAERMEIHNYGHQSFRYKNPHLAHTASLPVILWGYIGFLDMLEWKGMKSPTNSQGAALLSGSLDLSLSWGSSRQNIRRKMNRWMGKQHQALWRGPCNKQRQARELISGPDLVTGAWLLSFNRNQSKDIIGLLTGHNTLRRHLCIMGLGNNPICRRCGTEEETSVHLLCVRPWPHSGTPTWVLFSGPRRY